MEKLLHERLTEIKYFNACTAETFMPVFGMNTDDCSGKSCETCKKEIVSMFINEIERYYIPRPRFESGEPVTPDSESENGIIYDWRVYCDGTYELVDDKYDVMKVAHISSPVYFPQPKVLDADGVEIKVGDTVWCLTNGGQKGKVRYLYSYGVQVEWEDGYLSDGVNQYNLTHKEPDSIEKVIESIVAFSGEYVKPGTVEGVYTEEWINRLTAIMERDE